MVKIILLL